MVLTVCFVLPGEPGFLATIPRVMRQHHREVERQRRGVRTTRLPVREVCALVFRATRVHRIPRSTFVTIAIRPS
jgi:hypothetical protein